MVRVTTCFGWATIAPIKSDTWLLNLAPTTLLATRARPRQSLCAAEEHRLPRSTRFSRIESRRKRLGAASPSVAPELAMPAWAAQHAPA